MTNDIFTNIEAGAQTIGQAIGFDPIGGAAVEHVLPPRVEGMGEWPGEGIFFGMPEGVYHSIFACSASTIKDMTVSPMYAWARSPLNPDREDDDTFFKILGRAYHVRICEGREAYERCYAVVLDKRDYPDALDTVDQIKAALVSAGEKPVTRVPLDDVATRAAKREDWIAQLVDVDPEAQILEKIIADHAAANEGKILITAEADKRIQIAARMIEADPELSKAFSGGHAEVSLFWFDAKTGAPCKARVDYLKMNAFVDLKSFSLKGGRPVDREIDFTIANFKHYIAVAHYGDAIEAVKRLVRERGWDAISYDHPDDDAQRGLACSEWAKRWAKVKDEPAALYVFQATGIAPITRGKIMARGSVYAVSHMAVERQRRAFVEYAKTFGADPWIDAAPIGAITDESVPMSATDFGDN